MHLVERSSVLIWLMFFTGSDSGNEFWGQRATEVRCPPLTCSSGNWERFLEAFLYRIHPRIRGLFPHLFPLVRPTAVLAHLCLAVSLGLASLQHSV